MPFQSYTTKDGLPSNQINALYQDSRGYLWIGTDNGLSVYDGTTFTNYSTVDGLSNNWITCLTESRVSPGTMWIGTIAGGVNRYASGKFTSIATVTDVAMVNTDDNHVWYSVNNTINVHASNSPHPRAITLNLDKRIQVTCLALGRDGEAWAGAADGTVLQFRDTVLVQQRKIIDGFIFTLLEDADGYLWMRVAEGVAKIAKTGFASGQATHYAIADKMVPYGLPGPMLMDREGNLWVGSVTEGLLKIADDNSYLFPLI